MIGFPLDMSSSLKDDNPKSTEYMRLTIIRQVALSTPLA
jgi:hypothetical protein